VPSSFHRYIDSLSSREILRSIRVATLPLSFSLRKAASQVRSFSHKTTRLAACWQERGPNVRLFLDSGIPSRFILNPLVPAPRDRPFTLLWVANGAQEGASVGA